MASDKCQNNVSRVLISWFCFMAVTNLMAQLETTCYTDAGKTVVSDGLFVRSAWMADYRFGKNNIAAGLQINFKSNADRILSGYFASASREWMIKNFPVEVQGFFILSPYSQILKETLWGFSLGTYSRHFVLKIGTSFRTYAYTRTAIKDYDITSNYKIHENWNPTYLLGYYVKPIDHRWNVGFALTNIDNFSINQDTNPAFKMHVAYRPGLSFNCFMEYWYKSAGAFNLMVNHFGFFIRTGIVWDITSKP
jgi:hypothetical protein